MLISLHPSTQVLYELVDEVVQPRGKDLLGSKPGPGILHVEGTPETEPGQGVDDIAKVRFSRMTVRDGGQVGTDMLAYDSEGKKTEQGGL